ncbi:MAG: phosphoribosylamine--glycine ligase [Endomicrobium sp.]|jgi:phosphoribosylamine--glycine ligase|nr:phosphoribosylamine--glycine ligase [Endomicrobium sp.]
MKVLVIGSGGRESAICWRFAKDANIEKVYCAPGNDGIAKIAEIVNIPACDFENLANFVKEKKIDFTFVGPEIPLSLGIVDYFNSCGLKVIGPSKDAAKLESSKIYSKEFMNKYGIATAKYSSFSDIDNALNYIDTLEDNKRLVIKADGLAAGKGVHICSGKEEAKNVVYKMMKEKVLGDAGNNVVVEEYIDGQELSYLVFTDGIAYSLMPVSQDHKRINDKDQGVNTGGMGAYAPALLATVELNKKVEDIVKKVIYGISQEKLEYKGVLYVGIIVSNGLPYVLEFNCRFGDPETQAILPLLETNLSDICIAILEQKLSKVQVKWKNKFSVCVVLTSGGYPESFKTGFEIKGLDNIVDNNTVIFYAGVKSVNDKFVTSGGRVVGITSVADNIEDAINKVYASVNLIHFDGMHFRRDIAWRALSGKK